MMLTRFLVCFSVVVCLAGFGCKPPAPKIDKVELTPVKGVVTVDGAPQKNVVIRCEIQGEMDEKSKEVVIRSATRTAENGSFSFTTYEANDGLPPGDYALTFIWPPESMRRMSAKEELDEDRLNQKYTTVETSPLKFKLEKGKPLTLETVDLKSK